MEQFREGVVRQLFRRLTQLLTLVLNVIIVVVYEVLVVRLILYCRAFCIRVQIVHIREPHPSELIFHIIFRYVQVNLTVIIAE